MLSLGNWKAKLFYAAIGSLFGCLFTIMGILANPVTAQDGRIYRSYIECTELKVVNEAGESKVLLGVDGRGGVIKVYGNNGQSEVSLSITEHGGAVSALGEDGKSKAVLGINENGGFVRVTGRSKGEVFIGLEKYGGGYFVTKDKNGYRK